MGNKLETRFEGRLFLTEKQREIKNYTKGFRFFLNPFPSARDAEYLSVFQSKSISLLTLSIKYSIWTIPLIETYQHFFK